MGNWGYITPISGVMGHYVYRITGFWAHLVGNYTINWSEIPWDSTTLPKTNRNPKSRPLSRSFFGNKALIPKHDAVTQTPVFCIAHLVKMSWIHSRGNKTVKLWKLPSPKKTWMNRAIVHKTSPAKKRSKWKSFLDWIWPYNYKIL